MSSLARRLLAALAGVACAAAVSLLPGVDGVGGVATACAQVPTPPELPIPTLGPLDPTCSRVPDTDQDKVFDFEDNCHHYYNPSQADTDGDAGEPPYEPIPLNPRDERTGGDACDIDDDSDGLVDATDNCPKTANADQADTDADGIGDACDPQTAPPAGGAAGAGPRIVLGRLPRRIRVAQMGRVLIVPVRCSAACELRAEVRVDRRTARRLGRGSRVLGRGSAAVAGRASTFVFVRLSSTTLRRIRRARAITATVRVRAGAASASRRVRLSR